MSLKDQLISLLDGFADDRLREVLDYAEFLSWQEERTSWRQFGRGQIARAYGPNEPEYTSADLKPQAMP